AIDLLHGVRRQADDRGRADERARRRRREIVLTDVDAAGICQPRNIRAVVDDERRSARTCQLDDRRRRVEEGPAADRLRTQLQESRAAVEERRCEIDWPPPGARCGVDVDDRVKSGDWGLGIGDWGDWGDWWWVVANHHHSPFSVHPNPQSPIPNHYTASASRPLFGLARNRSMN